MSDSNTVDELSGGGKDSMSSSMTLPLPQSDEFKAFGKILFPDSETGDFQMGPDELAYLSRLGTQGLESLVGEVARVNEELAIIEHQTRDMASQNYQIFVQSAQTTNLIKKSLSEAKQSVETLSTKSFPEIKAKTDTFLSENGPSNEFIQGQAGVQSLVEKESDLAHVLDMPWVVRRCLANSDDKMLPEAIKILHIVMDYKKSLGDAENRVPTVLATTMSAVLDLQTQIQNALLQKLQSPTIGLSDCLQTVQLLRNFFPSDQSLRFRFLQSRMNKEIEFENSRSWIFDTLTQHRAAFGQDSAHYLSTFIALQLTRVLTDLQKHIDLKHQTLDSLFTNANYFGESLARVGADLRGLVVPLFSEFILKKASHDLLQAEMNFSKNLHQLNLSTCLIQQDNIKDDMEGGMELPADLSPPMQLLSFHPLAVYCNDVLSLLNAIGKCPLTQSVEVCKKLNQSLGKVGNELEAWGEGEWLTWEQREQGLFNRMRRVFENLLVPHLDKVFRVIYPPGGLAKVTGLNVAKCAEVTEIRNVLEYQPVPHLDKVFRVIYPPGGLAKVTDLNVAKCAEVTEIRVIYPPGGLAKVTGLNVAKCVEVTEIKYVRPV